VVYTKTTVRRVVVATSLVAVSGLAVACGSSGSASSSQGGSAAGSKTVKIGYLGPETGPVAPALAPELDGAKAAVAWLNAGNGAKGITYTLDVRDDQGDPNQAAVQGRALIADKVNVLIGPIDGTNGLEAVQPAVDQAKIVSIGNSTDISTVAGEGRRCSPISTSSAGIPTS
jgi:branched-chain amino acid transport system substrate-binding protein